MRILKLGLIGMTAAGFAGFASQVNAADQTGNATAEIQQAIVITEDVAMDFATILADPAGDTVTLDTADAVTSSGSSTFTGTPASGAFSVVGTPSAAVTISFSSGDVLTGPGTDMALGSFTTDAGGSPAFDVSGDLDFAVGADLTVGASQAGGSYAGTYTLTVDYQ